MMRDFILYLQGWVTLGLLLLAALKLLAMHGLPLPHNENQKDFATNSPKRGNANELDDEMSEIEPLKAGELIEPIVFEPKRKIRLSRSTYKVNSYIDFRPYQDSFKKFETYLHRCYTEKYNTMDRYSNTDTIQTLYREIQCNRYVQQYRYNMDAIRRNTKCSLIS